MNGGLKGYQDKQDAMPPRQDYASEGSRLNAPKQDGLVESVSSALSDATRLAQRVESLVNRLCGIVPVAAREGSGGYPDVSVFEGIRNQIRCTSADISDANDALTRLEGQLG